MEPKTQLKCACANCGQMIEFLPEAAGEIIECPNCKEKSRLPEAPSFNPVQPGPQQPPLGPPRLCPACGARMAPYGSTCEICESRRRRNLKLIIGVVSAVCVLGIAWLFLRNFYSPSRQLPRAQVFLLQPQVKTPKSLKDFKISPFRLESKRGSDLVMAVGDVQNISENLYLHLKATVDLLDAKGVKIGAASSEINELLPGKTWRFLATVNNPRVKSARFADLKEIQ